MRNIIFAHLLFAVSLSAAPINILDEHFVTLGTGQTITATFSTAGYTNYFGGLPTGAGFYGSGTPPPEGATSLTIAIQSFDGLVSWSKDVAATPAHFRFGPEGALLWEGDGFSVSAPMWMWIAPAGLFGSTVVLKITNNGAPLIFGDPIHTTFEDVRIGLSLWGPGGSVGAGIATSAVIEDTIVENPEPGTLLITAFGTLLLAAVRYNSRGRSNPSQA